MTADNLKKLIMTYHFGTRKLKETLVQIIDLALSASSSDEIQVEAHPAGELDAGSLQEALNDLSERVKALEDAP